MGDTSGFSRKDDVLITSDISLASLNTTSCSLFDGSALSDCPGDCWNTSNVSLFNVRVKDHNKHSDVSFDLNSSPIRNAWNKSNTADSLSDVSVFHMSGNELHLDPASDSLASVSGYDTDISAISTISHHNLHSAPYDRCTSHYRSVGNVAQEFETEANPTSTPKKKGPMPLSPVNLSPVNHECLNISTSADDENSTPGNESIQSIGSELGEIYPIVGNSDVSRKQGKTNLSYFL